MTTTTTPTIDKGSICGTDAIVIIVTVGLCPRNTRPTVRVANYVTRGMSFLGSQAGQYVVDLNIDKFSIGFVEDHTAGFNKL